MKRFLYIMIISVVSILFVGMEQAQGARQEKNPEASQGTPSQGTPTPSREAVFHLSLTEGSKDTVEKVFDPKRVVTNDYISNLAEAPKCKYTVEITNTSTDEDHSIFFGISNVENGEVFAGKKWERKNLTFKHAVTFTLQKGEVETVREDKVFCIPCFSSGFESVGKGTLVVYRHPA